MNLQDEVLKILRASELYLHSNYVGKTEACTQEFSGEVTLANTITSLL